MANETGDVHAASGRCEGCAARYEPGEVSCSMCGRPIGATAGGDEVASTSKESAVHREHPNDQAAFALERARNGGRLPAMMREEPSRATALGRQRWRATSALGLVLLGIALIAFGSPNLMDSGNRRTSRHYGRRHSSPFNTPFGRYAMGWLLVITGGGTAVACGVNWARIRSLPPAHPRLAWSEAMSTSKGLMGRWRYTARLRYEDGSRQELRPTTDAWQVMLAEEVGVAWIVDDRVMHWNRVSL
ncbi:MAG: hypothetical protein ACYTG4_06590 [Planctomycetota bacterium]